MQIGHLEYNLDDAILTQRTLRLRIGAADVRLAIDRAAANIRDEVSAPGFRKGKAPLAQIRKHHKECIHGKAFEELKRDALDQVLKQLADKDKPFLPPEVLEREKVKLRYGRSLEFAVKYMTDPAGAGQRPGQPGQEPGSVVPGSQVQHPAQGPMGVPAGPMLPKPPG